MRVHPRALASHTPKLPLILPIRPPEAPSSSSLVPAPTTPAKPSPRSSSKPATTPAPSLLPRPRPDYARILADPQATTANHYTRRAGLSPEHVAHISRLRETQLLLLRKLESVRSKQNEISTLIKNQLGDTAELVRQAKKLKVRVGEYELNLGGTEEELLDMSLALPNFSHPAVPLGPEDNAIEIDRFGPAPRPASEDRDHMRFCTHYDLIDPEASATATGSSWPYLRGAAASLEMALVNYAVSVAVRHGYTPVIPPDVVKQDIASRCGFAPRDSGGAQQTYSIADSAEGHVLAGTAEIPLSALFANRVLNPGALPTKVVGVGHAFRAEAGARGADTRGLYRVHQFTKVELFCVADAASAERVMDDMKALQREIAAGLGLSVRVLEMPTEELGASAARKWDMEAWMPGRGKWGEVSPLIGYTGLRLKWQISSLSNCTDYQSRRLHIRHRPTAPPPGQEQGGDPLPFAHTLNGTAAAVPRLIVALLENGAQLGERGQLEGLELPDVLQKFWVGTDKLGEGGKEGRITWRRSEV